MRRSAIAVLALAVVATVLGAAPPGRPARASTETVATASGTASSTKADQTKTSAPTDEPILGNLAPTPPMGWNSWNNFHCDINEELIRQTADAMVASGMKAAGYEYVNIDDCWMAPQRDAQGRLQADPERFPSGIKALADYVHSKGLKLGIYSSAGTKTCQGLPASLGHEEIDARTFAKWGVDYLKYDNCYNQGVPAKERYSAMAEAIKQTGRDIVLSICEWGQNDPWLWGRDVGGHLWRTTGDINDSWESVMSILDQQVGLEKYSGPNGWNDPDMLEVGNGGMSVTEYRAHMGLWALLNAPLLAGNDLRNMSETALSILTDPDVIAVNQDWGGEQGSKRRDDGDTEVWAKPMSDGSVAVVLLNRDERTRTIAAHPVELGLPEADRYTMRDLWADTTRETQGTVRASVPAHGGAMFVVRPAEGTPHEPAVTLGTDGPAYVEPGEPVAMTTTLYNDGTTPINSASLDVEAPGDWSVSPENPVERKLVAPGHAARVEWTLQPGGDAQPGTVNVTARAEWNWLRGRQERATTAPLQVVKPIPAGEHYLSDLDWVDADNGWGPVERDTSNGEREAGDGNVMSIGGTTYEKGLGVHAPSVVTYFAGGDCTRMSAFVGVDDEEGGEGSVAFEVWGDGERLAATDTIVGGQPAVQLTADTSGVDLLELRVTDGGDGVTSDHGDWAQARITCG